MIRRLLWLLGVPVLALAQPVTPPRPCSATVTTNCAVVLPLGLPIPAFAVSVLPTAALATINAPYIWTNSWAPFTCPGSGAQGPAASGTATAYCWTPDNVRWFALGSSTPASTATPVLIVAKSPLWPKCNSLRTTFCQ